VLTRVGTPQLLVATSFLVAGGLVMVYSASALHAEIVFGDGSVYMLRQLSGLALGLCAALFLSRVPLQLVRRSGYALWVMSALLLVITLTPLGISENGARRWLSLGGVVFQPLEFAKLGVILALAQWLTTHRQRMRDVRVSLGVPALFACFPAVVLLCQPDFGGALLILLFTAVVIFAAGARLDHLGVGALVALPSVVFAAVLYDYRLERLRSFLDPWADEFGSGFQLIQSMVAFGSGGLTGTGLGSGTQKLGYLPEAHTDFILSVVGEEVGLIGVVAVLVLFAIVGLSTLGIALRAKDTYARLLAVGAGLLVWLQALVNAGVALGALPTTGATLPLFSYGRTSLIVSLAAVGLLLNAARPQRRGRSGWRS
jgi:cell division protein FtsW